jgi:two-component system chemotaxis response regulator CheY
MNKTILTAEDSSSLRQLMSTTLQEAGYDVIEAADGQEALDLLADEEVGMLITDLNMPRLNGLNLIREIRKDPSNRFLPILMLTSETEISRRQEGKKAGASAWIQKPFKPEQLLKVVQMVLG